MYKILLLICMFILSSFLSNGQAINKTVLNSKNDAKQKEMAAKADVFIIDKKSITDTTYVGKKVKSCSNKINYKKKIKRP